MVKNYILSFFIIMIVALHSNVVSAGFDGETETVKIVEDSFSLFPRHFYTLELIHNPIVSESEFTMRFSSHGVVSGCNEMYNSYLEKKEVSKTIKISIIDSEIDLKNYEPRYGNYDCEINYNRSYFDVILDRDELIKNKTKHVEIESDAYGKFAKFNINVSKEKIEVFVKNIDSTFMKTLWFFPANSIVIYAPKAKLGEDVKKEIKEFAKNEGLIAMEDYYKYFELPYDAYNYAIFVDPEEKFAPKINNIGESIKIGETTIYKTMYDANGLKKEPYSLELYATLPGKKILREKDKYDKYDRYLNLGKNDN